MWIIHNYFTLISTLQRDKFFNDFSISTTVVVEFTSNTFSGDAPISDTDLLNMTSSLYTPGWTMILSPSLDPSKALLIEVKYCEKEINTWLFLEQNTL